MQREEKAKKGADNKYVLAIDHGTSGVKTAIVSIHGEIVDFESEKTPVYFLPNGGAEQDPDDWWNALVKTSKRLINKNVVPASDIAAVCVSSTMSSTVAVDSDGHHLMNSLTWMDSRGAPYVRELMGGFPSISGYSLLNVLRWIPKTGGGPTLSGKDDIAHVLLVKHEYPEVYQKTHMFLESKDYLNLRLTGEFAGSYDSTILYWVTDIRNINNVHYDDKLINRLKIDKNKLPPLKSSIDILGTVSKEVADELGLGPEVKVVMGAADHQAALVGSGAIRDFEGHLYIGTSSWVECVVPFKKTDVFHSIASLPAAIPGKYQCINEQDIAGGVLPFLVDNIIYHKNPLRTDEPPPDIYKKLDEIAERVPPGSNKLIFTPWLNGERSPVDNTMLRAGLYNVSMTTNMDHIIRAFFEGVAYNTRWNLKYVERFIGRKMDTLNFIGGGALSNVWCQIFADVFDRTIRQVENPMQANARGAALIASVALGYITFDDIPQLIRYSNTYYPNPENRTMYDELFEEFLKIYNSNNAMYRRLNKNPVKL